MAASDGPLGVGQCLTLFGVAGIAGTHIDGRAAPAAMFNGSTAMEVAIAVAPALAVLILLRGFAGWTYGVAPRRSR